MDSTILIGDCMTRLAEIESRSVDCVVTSPPYYALRKYTDDEVAEIGNEPTPADYVRRMNRVFYEVGRALKVTGTLWVNLGDTYAKRKYDEPPVQKKSLIGIPWRVAISLIDDGWLLRNEVIWAKPNAMPSSATDRLTPSHEQLFFFTQSGKYASNFGAIKEPATCAGQSRGGSKNRYDGGNAGLGTKVYDTRNKRDVWSIKPATANGAHFAVFPEELVEPCILAGCPEGGTVLDPFLGSGTTGRVAKRLGRDFIGIELNATYAAAAEASIDAQGDSSEPMPSFI